MIRYWFEFKIDSVFEYPFGIGLGCGVTAYNYDDAIRLMDEKIFHSSKWPLIEKVVENVDIRNLDNDHVIPNMKSPAPYGVWYPLGFD